MTAAGTGSLHGVGVAVPTGSLTLEGLAPSVEITDSLIALRADGVKLRNESIKLEDLEQWKERVRTWKRTVLTTLKGRANPADRARFETLDLVQPMRFKHACNNEHNRHLSILTRRLAILLEILAALK
jgi:hypothetical protein